MKRFVLLAVIVALVAAGILFALRRAGPTSPVAVAALLPGETIGFVHVPDFNRTRDQWHSSDVYKLYREPAVQDFLQRPLSKIPRRETGSQTLREIEQLEMKDGFIAVTSTANNNPLFLAGFRYGARRSTAEKIIDGWRGELPPHGSVSQDDMDKIKKGVTARLGLPPPTPTPSRTVDYQGHKIAITGEGVNLTATVYDGDWFFAANDLDQLKALLDRADHRTPVAEPNGPNPESVLEKDEAFHAAMAHMPASYVALFYLQPKTFAEKLTSLRAEISHPIPADQRTMIEQIRSVCGAIRFDSGKIRDVWFVGIQQQEQEANLARSAAALGTSDTFLYLATLLNAEKLTALNQPGSSAPVAAWLQKLFDAGSRSGLTVSDWKTAFDLELGTLADWPTSARWPSLIATLPVKDPSRAEKIAAVLTSVIDEDGAWTKTEKDGVRYFSMPSPSSFLAVTPTIALSNKLLVAGVDFASVETAMKRSVSPGPGLTATDHYKLAARALPEPTNFFAYLDLPLLYSRLDASLRPMLLMTAAFMPAISEHIDVTKLPPPDIVVKHLSPIVSSQRYDRDGYILESVGPITLNQAAVVLGLPAIFWWSGQHSGH